jgi:hypothetical protein
MPMTELMSGLPTAWVERFVECFEAGRLQKHPQARFINERGECCLVGALAGARSAAELLASPVYASFLGTELETLSRHFEAGRLTGQDFYEESLLLLATRLERLEAAHV